MDWVVLVVAGLFEAFWAYELKLSNGFTVLLPSVLMVLGLIASMVLLGVAMRSIDLPIAYAVWTGIGIVGTTVVSAASGMSPLNVLTILFIALIAAGVVGLAVVSQ